MKTIDAISMIVKQSGKTKRALSASMGKSPNYLCSIMGQSERLSGGVNSSTLAAIAQACGCVLAVVPADDVPESATVIDPA